MRILNFHKGLLLFGALLLIAPAGIAQKASKAATPKPIIFAVLSDATTLEPIAYINKGKLEPPVNGSDEQSRLTAFNRSYYKKGAVYRVIFGGANVGTATVTTSNPNSDCAKNMATVAAKTSNASLKGLVMGLATNSAVKSKVSFRRRPTPAEKDEADALARAEFSKQKLTPTVLRFQNLTTLDLDNDGKPEMVGSYWVEIDKLTRGLLFFIAGKDSSGKYSIGYHEYRTIDQASVMSREIKSVDDGVYHELLLDVFDYDADGTSEIFTYVQSFEAAGFNVYRRNGGKWTRSFEVTNYHCGY